MYPVIPSTHDYPTYLDGILPYIQPPNIELFNHIPSKHIKNAFSCHSLTPSLHPKPPPSAPGEFQLPPWAHSAKHRCHRPVPVEQRHRGNTGCTMDGGHTCWWFRNPGFTSWYVVYPVIYGRFIYIYVYIYTCTVVQEFFHQQYGKVPIRCIYIYLYMIWFETQTTHQQYTKNRNTTIDDINSEMKCSYEYWICKLICETSLLNISQWSNQKSETAQQMKSKQVSIHQWPS